VDVNVLVVLHSVIVIIIAILLIYYAFLLLKRLKSRDLAVSMLFLHEKDIQRVFLIIALSSLLFFICQVYFSVVSNENSTLLLKIGAYVYSFALLYFAYKLQKVLKGGEADGNL
jgi:hypothetical protein